MGASAAAVVSSLIVVPEVAAAPCPDAEVVFARGTTEPPGVGGIGQAFVDSLRSQVGGRSVGVYAVNYPASNDFSRSAPAGSADLAAHVQAMAANCPNTKMVLGGYSQGAAVVDLATSSMPPDVADNVAAAAVFGGPRSSFADSLSPGPLPSIGPLYTAKTIEMCVPNDPICFQNGWDMRAHGAYVQTGMVSEAAAFAASRIMGAD
ncbi:cutinase family protein [Mycolicibacterium agri]|uniref:Cutinase family protein n=1 Tax=Mycolicibacterium agri TaxID=36811 RepID=A0A2A7N2J8_MYCAG|nr:cutinase family protein [Mycolicibacterium agri]